MAKRNSITFALAALFVLGLAAGALAGIPDTNNSTAYADNCGRFTIAPCGGETLIEGANDYTVHVTVLDINGNPVTTLAATDLYLYHDELATCPGVYSQADAGTDTNGQTQFTGQIFSGVSGDLANGIVCDDLDLYVYAQGIILNGANPVCVAVDSPDLNGDTTVSVADFGKFAADYNCVGAGVPCDSCHDFNEDGETSVADFGIFASYYNVCSCP